MTTAECRRRLGYLWFPCCGLIFLFVLFLTTLGPYHSMVSDTWGWFLASVLPTLSLMVSVFVVDRDNDRNQTTANLFLFRLTFWLSLSYFVLLLATLVMPIVLAGLHPLRSGTAKDFIKQAQQFWLSPVQGLVAGFLGAFFVKS